MVTVGGPGPGPRLADVAVGTVDGPGPGLADERVARLGQAPMLTAAESVRSKDQEQDLLRCEVDQQTRTRTTN